MGELKHSRWETIDDIVVLHLAEADTFDRLARCELQEEIISYLQVNEVSNLLFNFCNVRYIAGGFIDVILKARERIIENGGTLKLCEMRESIREIFKIGRLDGTVFEIHNSMHQALDAFEESRAESA